MAAPAAQMKWPTMVHLSPPNLSVNGPKMDLTREEIIKKIPFIIRDSKTSAPWIVCR